MCFSTELCRINTFYFVGVYENVLLAFKTFHRIVNDSFTMKYKETVEQNVDYSMAQPLRVVLFKDTAHIMERVYRAFSVTVMTMTLHTLKTLTLKKDIANFPYGEAVEPFI